MLVGSKMAFCGDKRLWEMLAHNFDGETRPSGKVSRLDSSCPRGDDRTAHAEKEVLNEVLPSTQKIGRASCRG